MEEKRDEYRVLTEEVKRLKREVSKLRAIESGKKELLKGLRNLESKIRSERYKPNKLKAEAQNVERLIDALRKREKYGYGKLGERYMKGELESRFPKDKFLVLDGHELFELDFIVIEKEKEVAIEIHEVKTTAMENPTEFQAGSRRQLYVFNFQKIKKQGGTEFIPFFLDVVKINREAWFDGRKFEVSEVEIYDMDSLKADLEEVRWILKKGKHRERWEDRVYLDETGGALPQV